MRVAKQGWPFIGVCIGVGAIFLLAGGIFHLSWMVWPAGLCYLAAFYCAYFFRDPKRVVPTNEQWVLSPADGKIMEAGKGEDNGTPVWIIRIFLSVFDPHLQRAPLAGTVKTIRYTKGKFLDARDPKAHFENEQNRIEFSTKAGLISVTQIAGLIARRIVWWIKEGDTLAKGQQYGLIRFGSQVDMTLPLSATLRVKVGDRVEAGATVLAELP